MINFNNAEFIISSSSTSEHLYDYPQVLFIGKSNVGKSSLINALTNRKNLAYGRYWKRCAPAGRIGNRKNDRVVKDK